MAIFNSYVKLPECITSEGIDLEWEHIGTMERFVFRFVSFRRMAMENGDTN